MHTHMAKHQANDSTLSSLLQVQHLMQNLNNNWMVRYVYMETAQHFRSHFRVLGWTNETSLRIAKLRSINAVKYMEAVAENNLHTQMYK